MHEDSLEYSVSNGDIVSASASRGVGLYVEVHMAEDAKESTVTEFVREAVSRGMAAAYDRAAHRRVDLYVDWSDDQHLEAERLKRWVAELPFVRLLIIEYAYDGRKAPRC